MRYVSTRGQGETKTFREVLFSGLAEDGGLYVPESTPVLSPLDLDNWRTLSYPMLAERIVSLFASNSIPNHDIRQASVSAFEHFSHSAVAPLKQLDSHRWLLELFHGPTFAFKDYALQLVSQLIERCLLTETREILVLCATSGDTGAAAAAAFADRRQTRIVVLHPVNRVSPVQRRQMTTINACNLANLALEGTFDDCQSIVKQLLRDKQLQILNPLSVNSINWARITSQITYYAWTALSIGTAAAPVNFVVPTGNFGNVLAGLIAKRMGLPIGRLILSSNENDVLPRFFETGTMQSKNVVSTLSPSMDIQISSNFERFLYDLKQSDGGGVAAAQKELQSVGHYQISSDELAIARSIFSASRCDTNATLKEMQQTFEETGEVLCPHTATAAHAARQLLTSDSPTVVVATAHPAKFPDAIRKALGQNPPVPSRFLEIENLPEHFDVLPATFETVRKQLIAP